MLTCMVAWSGVLASPGPGADPDIVSLGAQGPGTLLAPVGLFRAVVFAKIKLC